MRNPIMIRTGGTSMMMTTMAESIMTMLLAKMLMRKGKWSAIVSLSDVRTQISLDLLFEASWS